MRGARTAGSKRVYSWLPKTAADTSKPLPTLPCAKQWTYCDRLCASLRPSLAASVPPSVRNESAGMTPRCSKSPETREVIRAAEDPRPVLWTSARRTPVLLNAGSFWRESNVGANFCSASYVGNANQAFSVSGGNR